jgi:hypothetical protein
MPRVEAIRSEIQRLLRAVPFRPFAVSLENGDTVIIGHPENIAFDPGTGSEDFYVIANQLRLFGTFSAITSVFLLDREELAG